MNSIPATDHQRWPAVRPDIVVFVISIRQSKGVTLIPASPLSPTPETDILKGGQTGVVFTVLAHSPMASVTFDKRSSSQAPSSTRCCWSRANNEHEVGIASVSWLWMIRPSRSEEPAPT